MQCSGIYALHELKECLLHTWMTLIYSAALSSYPIVLFIYPELNPTLDMHSSLVDRPDLLKCHRHMICFQDAQHVWEPSDTTESNSYKKVTDV